MERSAIFHGNEDRNVGGFLSLQEAINHWLVENKDVYVVHRETALVYTSPLQGGVMMVVTIFYREPAKQ